MKKYFYIIIVLLALVSCSSEGVISDPALSYDEKGGGAIAFNIETKAVTRSESTGYDAALLLNKNFVIEGVKGNDSVFSTVFDNYNVNWVEGSSSGATSGWEYVNQPKHPNARITSQGIKYWDYGAAQYDFIAYSLGNGADLMVSPIRVDNMATEAYTVSGAADELAKVYIADMVTAYNPADFNTSVKFKFRPLSSKIRVAMYETVPGYSVKDVVFYTDDNTVAADNNVYLYTTGTDSFNSKGKYTVKFPTTGTSMKNNPDYNKAHLVFEADATSEKSSLINFGAMDMANTGADKEVGESAGKQYIGRSSNTPSYAGTVSDSHYTIVIPNEAGVVLNLKVNYKLVSTDVSGEIINVTGATAQIPAEYSMWKSGYAYTYLFKISLNSNGYTGTDPDASGLYPITFDAVVSEDIDGIQETISTVSDPSITSNEN